MGSKAVMLWRHPDNVAPDAEFRMVTPEGRFYPVGPVCYFTTTSAVHTVYALRANAQDSDFAVGAFAIVRGDVKGGYLRETIPSLEIVAPTLVGDMLMYSSRLYVTSGDSHAYLPAFGGFPPGEYWTADMMQRPRVTMARRGDPAGFAYLELNRGPRVGSLERLYINEFDGRWALSCWIGGRLPSQAGERPLFQTASTS